MKVLRWIGFAIAGLVVLFVFLLLIAPTGFTVKQSIKINAPKDFVFSTMRDFSKFEFWSPWAELDPNTKVEFKGTYGQVGSIYLWEGNDKVGSGQQEIVAISDSTVELMVRFKTPWQSESPTYYKILDRNGQTLVEWASTGTMPRPFNVLGLFINIEKAIGKDYEKGLLKLKAYCESKKDTLMSAYM